MKSVILAIVLASSCPASTSIYDAQRQLAVEFDKYWNRYARGLFGCEEHGEMTPETCPEWRSHVDYDAYNKAAKIAAKIFPAESR